MSRARAAGEAFAVTRRSFLIGLNLGLGGLALGIGPRRAGAAPAVGGELSPHVLLHIAPDGATTIICHRSEMGQGVRTAIPALIADELGADAARVVVRQADGDKKYGDQNTDGSTSIRKGYDALRQAGAAARMMLIAAAAKRWKVAPSSLTTRAHHVVQVAARRSIGFGALVAEASRLPVPRKDEIALRPDAELTRIRRTDEPLLDGVDIATGKAVFGADVSLPGMLVAVIARPPVPGGKVMQFDAAGAMAVPGVKRVIELPAVEAPYAFKPWGGVAVVAEHTWAALKGRAGLKIEWDAGVHGGHDSDAHRRELLASVRAPGTRMRELGDVDGAMARATRVVEAEYTVPHLHHLTMEPPVALARVDGDRVELWLPTQHPQGAQTEVARLLGVPPEKVTVHVTLLGGGFGRKSKADFAGEAAFLARAMAAPVRVQWTRDDDVRHGYYNAVSAQRLRAGLDASGAVTSWHHRTAFTPTSSTSKPNIDGPALNDLQQGVLDLALAVPNVRAEACKATPRSRIGWYRSVYNIFHAFAIGSFVDELAVARGVDPRQMWLDLIGPPRQLGLADLGVAQLRNYGEPLDKHPVDAGRLRNVIERVTQAAGWSGRGERALGLAAHRSFVSYTAVVVSVVPDPRRVARIDEAWITMDAGRIVSPDRVHAQLEGAVVMGISNALYGGITMKRGATVQSSFRDARIARIADVPRRIHVEVVDSTAPPGGVGEPGVPPVGAALANAIFALTGKRIRSFPLAAGLR